MVLEVLDIGVAAQEPQQLVDDGAEVEFLGGEQGEAVLQGETHLVAEDAHRACAGAVQPLGAVVEHVL